MSVYISDGVVILSGGSIATSDACCCGIGACCFDCDPCDSRSQADCEAAGGTYQGDGTHCSDDPAPCPDPAGACCVGETCSIETESDCTGMGGSWQGCPSDCDPNPCPPTELTGACCVGGTCSITTEADCPGTYMGDGSICELDTCRACNSCGFNGFLSGGTYLTREFTWTANNWAIGAPFPEEEHSCETEVIGVVSTQTCDPDTGIVTAICTGSATSFNDDPCNVDAVWVANPFVLPGYGCWWDSTLCGCTETCSVYPGDPVPISDTFAELIYHCPFCDEEHPRQCSDAHLTLTLSDPCIP
jgi:hypothetical protein